MAEEDDFLANFKPDFVKSYNIKDIKFDVQIQYTGITSDHPSAFLPVRRWIFAIIVNGYAVEAGPFHLDNRVDEIKDEQVANRLASFWCDSDSVKKAQDLPPMFDIDAVMWKCSEYMKNVLLIEKNEVFEFDILQKTVDSGEWFVILQPHPMRNMTTERIFTFKGYIDRKMMTVARYVQEGTEYNVVL